METSAVDEHGDRPWEQPGRVRRDCEPHRGPLLHLLAVVSLACGLLSFCTGVSALIGLLLGIAVIRMARRDLGSMRRGWMDPAGLRQTDQAEAYAIGGVVCSVMLLSVLGFIFILGWMATHVR